MSTSRPPTPRHLAPYSPRRPSPLGFPPLAPHVAFHQPAYAWPTTPDKVIQPKGASNIRVPFPPEARRPLAGSTRRRMSQPIPPPLDLRNQHDHLPPPPKTGNVLLVPGQELLKPPLSPTPSETSSLSMYSAESIKDLPIEVRVHEQKQREEEERPSKNPFCGCFCSFFFGSHLSFRAEK